MVQKRVTEKIKWKHPAVRRLVAHIRKKCKENRVTVMLRNVPAIIDSDDGGMIVGFFEEPTEHENGKLRVAAGRPLPVVLHILCHEFVHFLQWHEGRSIYTEKNYAKLEEKTEREAIRMMKKFSLPIDLNVRKRVADRYIQRLRAESPDFTTNVLSLS